MTSNNQKRVKILEYQPQELTDAMIRNMHWRGFYKYDRDWIFTYDTLNVKTKGWWTILRAFTQLVKVVIKVKRHG